MLCSAHLAVTHAHTRAKHPEVGETHARARVGKGGGGRQEETHDIALKDLARSTIVVARERRG